MNFSVVLWLLTNVVFALAADFIGETVNSDDQFYCFSTDQERVQTQMHSTLTSYEATLRNNFDPSISSCTPSRFWMVSRHGGRLPSTNVLNDMIAFAESSVRDDIARNRDQGRTTLCRQDFELLRDWVRDPNITVQVQSLGTQAGWRSMESIGRRYQQTFPTALPSNYTRERYLFRYANTQRSRASISAFADGLFGENRWRDVVFELVAEQDVLLHPINFCPAFWDQVSIQPDFDAFAEGTEMENMLDEINSRLGFHGANQLGLSQVLLMWEWCRFETGSSSGTGAWCVPFTVHHHRVLEYYRDLHYYYFTGYGVPDQRLIQNINCNLMQDLLALMQSNNPNDRTVRLYSSFSQIVQAFLVTLGAFNDGTPLTHHNFAQQSSRLWRTSFLTPNAAHLVVVRYDCAGGDHDLVFLLNENQFHVPGCQPNGVCKLSFILSHFKRFIGVNCDKLFCTNQ